ncbi:MAG TPA: hypothetical protein VHX60_04775 [Acidobacteriaceae bacterium]|jgi:hypothetical protein|nr:hypothetical protein [Acidobacteriaceae bacterium]
MKSQTVLLATWRDGLFAFSGDARSHEIANVSVRGLAPDGRGGALAIVDGHSLLRRAPDGEWKTLVRSDFELSCCVAVGDLVYVGTDDARMLRLSDGGGVLQPIDAFYHVQGRDAWFAGSAIVDGQRIGPPLGVRSLAANSTGSILYANVHVGGIPRSDDGGRSWHPTIEINSDVHEVCAAHADPEIVVAAAAVGLCMSRDSGKTWTIEREGLHDAHCYAVAILGDDILFSSSKDPFAAPGRLYRRPLRSNGSIEAVEGGMPTWTEGMVDTACIATYGSSVAVADKGGNLYGSDDFGRTWSCTRAGLPAPSSILLC